MIFKKLIQTILLGLVLWVCLLFGVEQNPTMAATLTEAESISQSRMQTLSEPLNLELGVDRFLSSIPAGYYTIASVEGLKSQLENPQTLLVDVREPSEYRSGHIPNAINILLRTLTHSLDNITRDRSVVLYCSSGYRSGMGVMTLHLLGYENVQGFLPSFTGWKAAGEAISVAAIRQLEEAPGQMVYQSRQTLKDQHGNNWQAIAFKRIRADGETNFYLRLVGFPGVAKIDRSQPLTLTNSLGRTLIATEASSDIFTESATPEPNIG